MELIESPQEDRIEYTFEFMGASGIDNFLGRTQMEIPNLLIESCLEAEI